VTLTEFLLARIAEDESVARNSALHFDDGRRANWLEAASGVLDTGDELWTLGDSAISRHAERFDPARVLAECEAKRRIVELVRPDPSMPVDSGRFVSAGVLMLLALPYADHPDYRDEWRP